jgi:hypothetical protein
LRLKVVASAVIRKRKGFRRENVLGTVYWFEKSQLADALGD